MCSEKVIMTFFLTGLGARAGLELLGIVRFSLADVLLIDIKQLGNIFTPLIVPSKRKVDLGPE